MTAAVVIGAALIAALFYAAVQESSPAFAVALSAAAAVVIMLRLSASFAAVAVGLCQLSRRVDGEAFSCLARCAAILLLADYSSSMCEEAGAESLAWCTSFAGRCLTLAEIWPLLGEVCARIWELTG